jgi:formylglycine-generating enzyme required for sulfatase activity
MIGIACSNLPSVRAVHCHPSPLLCPYFPGPCMTEAEWEFACRAGTSTKFYTGDSNADLANAGWYDGNSGKRTHPVGGKVANAFGLFDMHGNVWEWCQDWSAPYAAEPQTDPFGPESGDRRVARGGSWDGFWGAAFCRSANRGSYTPASRFGRVGFRVVVAARPKTQ